uniref:Uncharacterized protein n=1 Tax=Solanum lycopersicum TaxID=4081 RepID=A0A3Q7IFA8_SOLLC
MSRWHGMVMIARYRLVNHSDCVINVTNVESNFHPFGKNWKFTLLIQKSYFTPMKQPMCRSIFISSRIVDSQLSVFVLDNKFTHNSPF